MQPDDLARRILDRGFLSSKEVREAAGAPPPARATTAATQRPRTWTSVVLAGAALVSILTGIFLARLFRDESLPAPPERPAQASVPAFDSPVREVINPKPADPDQILALYDERIQKNPRDQEALTGRVIALVFKVKKLPAGHERDRADEEARNAAAQFFQVAPGSPVAADLLWSAHAEIRAKLAALGQPALPQRVQALSTLREAMSQTLARNPSEPSCKKLVAAASLELGDAVAAAGQREKALELWEQAASLDASLLPEVERRKTGR